MRKILIKILYSLFLLCTPWLVQAQNTTLGDRNSNELEVKLDKAKRAHISSKRQKILLKRANYGFELPYENFDIYKNKSWAKEFIFEATKEYPY